MPAIEFEINGKAISITDAHYGDPVSDALDVICPGLRFEGLESDATMSQLFGVPELSAVLSNKAFAHLHRGAGFTYILPVSAFNEFEDLVPVDMRAPYSFNVEKNKVCVCVSESFPTILDGKSEQQLKNILVSLMEFIGRGMDTMRAVRPSKFVLSSIVWVNQRWCVLPGFAELDHAVTTLCDYSSSLVSRLFSYAKYVPIFKKSESLRFLRIAIDEYMLKSYVSYHAQNHRNFLFFFKLRVEGDRDSFIALNTWIQKNAPNLMSKNGDVDPIKFRANQINDLEQYLFSVQSSEPSPKKISV